MFSPDIRSDTVKHEESLGRVAPVQRSLHGPLHGRVQQVHIHGKRLQARFLALGIHLVEHLERIGVHLLALHGHLGKQAVGAVLHAGEARREVGELRGCGEGLLAHTGHRGGNAHEFQARAAHKRVAVDGLQPFRQRDRGKGAILEGKGADSGYLGGNVDPRQPVAFGEQALADERERGRQRCLLHVMQLEEQGIAEGRDALAHHHLRDAGGESEVARLIVGGARRHGSGTGKRQRSVADGPGDGAPGARRCRPRRGARSRQGPRPADVAEGEPIRNRRGRGGRRVTNGTGSRGGLLVRGRAVLGPRRSHGGEGDGKAEGHHGAEEAVGPAAGTHDRGKIHGVLLFKRSLETLYGTSFKPHHTPLSRRALHH